MYKYTHLIAADAIWAQGTYPAWTWNSSGRFEDAISYTCAAGTYPRSVSTILGKASYSSAGSVLESNFTVYANGSSTGIDTITANLPSTTQTTFSTVYYTDSLTTLSATATGKTSHSNASTYSYTATTLVPLFYIPDAATVARYYVARGELPPLREVASGFAFTAFGQDYAHSLSSGSYAFQSDQLTGTSVDNFALPGNPTPTETWTFVTYASVSYSERAAEFTAKRKRPTGAVYQHNGSSGSYISFDGVVGNSSVFLTSIASMLLVPKVFSTALVSADTSKTTTFAWRYTSGGWSLAYTTKNSSTSSTGYAGITISGTPLFTEENAVTVNGISSNILGPLLPFSSAGLNVLSSTRGGTNGGNSAAYSFACSSSGSSSSAVWSGSLSNTVSFAFTYTPDRLTGYANLPAAYISTGTSYWNPLLDDSGQSPFGVPAISKNSKWNEAGRQDPVEVQE